jgi:hypothetical protein
MAILMARVSGKIILKPLSLIFDFDFYNVTEAGTVLRQVKAVRVHYIAIIIIFCNS